MSDITYESLSAEGLQFLAKCGKLTINEHDRFEEPSNTSVNEMLGMATHILAEQAKVIQAQADAEDPEISK